MNRDLDTLRHWANDKARTDEDVAARPPWAQIAREVEAYVEGESITAPGPDLFGGAS